MKLLKWGISKLKKEIEQFVKNVLEEASGENIDDNSMLLLEEEILDSVSILYLVSELEDKYEIQIPLDDVVENNFKNIESIVEYTMSKIEKCK